MKKYLVLLLIATSCTPTYIPNIPNSPMFTVKGEVQLNFQVGNGLNGQGAIAITDNFGVIGNYSYLQRDNGDRSSSNYRKHTFGEGGIGYFKNNEKTFFEILTIAMCMPKYFRLPHALKKWRNGTLRAILFLMVPVIPLLCHTLSKLLKRSLTQTNRCSAFALATNFLPRQTIFVP